MRCSRFGAALLALLFLVLAGPVGPSLAQTAQAPAAVAPAAEPPPAALLDRTGNDADMWRAVRRGADGYVSIPNRNAAQLIQSEGDNWRTVRNGPYQTWAGWIILGMTGLLALFFAIRGRVRVDRGFSGIRIERFNAFERFAHWLTAISFVVLALTGLNLVFGRALLMPLMGKEAFATMTFWGKYTHDYTSFAFMLGLVIIFVLFVLQNFPNRHDFVWLAKGGGMIGNAHPPAKKFNAGQKILFWLVILCGLSLSLSGLQLLFPYQFPFFESTFTFLNGILGLDLPVALEPVHEQQLATLWHGFMGALMTALIIAHIYIGTIGMEGAFSAMGDGTVDLNWAREHHNLWVADMEKRGGLPADD
ncbi:formate dehydrogenase subunit gamma [Geminicoccaceae bacterium 1502E]|nr:formate dehydrogenase subunit gamma [Geminicoccaceae bacterium 1502E]